jgi:hypothetical protein
MNTLRQIFIVLIRSSTAFGLAYGADLAAKQGYIAATIALFLGASFWIVGAFKVDVEEP